MPRPRVSKTAARAERKRREQERRAALFAGWSLEAAAEGHLRQLAMARDPARHIIAMCSRRAGKSSGVCAWLADGALERPGTDSMYIALTSGQADWSVWERIWKPLCKRWGLPVRHDESEQITTFENGSRIIFAGTDDVAHIQTFLGSKLWRVVVDECQSQRDSVLRPLIETILPPALSDDGGQLLMAGTIPEVPAGVFWEVWDSGGPAWSRHSWSRFDNPHLREQRKRLDEHLSAHPGIKETDAVIQRDWHGVPVFDASVTAYKYARALNGYVPLAPAWLAEGKVSTFEAGVGWTVPERWYEGLRDPVAPPPGKIWAAVPLPGITLFTAGIDPGAASDRFAIEVWGWGEGSPAVQQVFEWVAPPGANVTWAQIGPILGAIQRHFAPVSWYYDAGSSKNEVDTFRADYQVPAIQAANKGAMPGQIRRVNDVLTTGRARVMIGSALEEDYQKARLDPDARSRGIWRWASAHHPDPSEAARYGLAGYFAAFEPAKPVQTPQQAAEAAERARIAELYVEPVPAPYSRDDQAAGSGTYGNPFAPGN